jgi:DNA gyrase subunit B
MYRHMPQLFDRGHVYIAVPPLYLVKMGSRQTYLEKDSQLEDLLVRDKFPQLEVTARDGAAVKLTEARYARFQRALAEFDGWAARLRADFGAPAANFVVSRRLVETDVARPDELAGALGALPGDGHVLSVVASSSDGIDLKVVESETSTAAHVTIPAALLQSPIYQNLRRTYHRLGDVVGGLPPFELALGKKRAQAETFDELRQEALELAKEGLQISRFKGLGEMNHGQLWDTTMDPERRMLIRVEVEDASAADLWFSRLMGDQVEPRREFIEQNAQNVRFLDV